MAPTYPAFPRLRHCHHQLLKLGLLLWSLHAVIVQLMHNIIELAVSMGCTYENVAYVQQPRCIC